MSDTRGYLNRILFLLIVALAIFSLTSASAQGSYAIRGEACYEHESDTGWDDFGRNIYVSGFVDYRLYSSEPWDFSLYVVPKAVYNFEEGLDLHLGVRVHFFILDSQQGVSLFKGARFPSNFLQECTVYLRVNIHDDY